MVPRFSLFKTPNSPSAAHIAEQTGGASEVKYEAKKLFGYKQEALSLAKQMAAERAQARAEAVAAGLDAGPNNDKPTITDYIIAAQQVGAKHNLPEDKWNPKIYSDLSSIKDRDGKTIPDYEMRIEGFQINKKHMEPDKAELRLASIRATQQAEAEGRKPTVKDALAQLQQIQQSGEKVPSIASMKDMYDLDCDHAIGKLFSNFDHHADFKGTVLAGCNFHPGDTLMRNGKAKDGSDNGIPITDGASFISSVFDGMGKEDILVLNRGQFTDITLKNINRGHVIVGENSVVRGLHAEGMQAEFSMKRGALVEGMTADAATRILTLNMEPKTKLVHSDLGTATISQASQMQDVTIENVTFGAGNFRYVDITSSKFNKVTFNGTDIEGTNFAGVRLNQVAFNDIDPAKLDLTGAIIENGVSINGKSYASVKDFDLAQQMAAAGVKNFLFQPELAAEIIPAPKPEVVAQQTAPQEPSKIGAISNMGEIAQSQATAETQKNQILFAGDVSSLNDVAISTLIAQMKRDVPVEQQATSANMNRDRQS